METDLLIEVTEAGINSIHTHRQKELIRHQVKLIRLRELIHHLLGVVVQEEQPAEEAIPVAEAEDAGDN